MTLRQRLNTFYASLLPEGVPLEERAKIDALLEQKLPRSAEEAAEAERQAKAKANREALSSLTKAFSLPS